MKRLETLDRFLLYFVTITMPLASLGSVLRGEYAFALYSLLTMAFMWEAHAHKVDGRKWRFWSKIWGEALIAIASNPSDSFNGQHSCAGCWSCRASTLIKNPPTREMFDWHPTPEKDRVALNLPEGRLADAEYARNTDPADYISDEELDALKEGTDG